MNTDRVFTIDGDNRVREEFFNEILEIDDEKQKDFVFSWCGHNVINGLAYGNGGVKLWPKHIITNMESHEKSTIRCRRCRLLLDGYILPDGRYYE